MDFIRFVVTILIKGKGFCLNRADTKFQDFCILGFIHFPDLCALEFFSANPLKLKFALSGEGSKSESKTSCNKPDRGDRTVVLKLEACPHCNEEFSELRSVRERYASVRGGY